MLMLVQSLAQMGGISGQTRWSYGYLKIGAGRRGTRHSRMRVQAAAESDWTSTHVPQSTGLVVGEAGGTVRRWRASSLAFSGSSRAGVHVGAGTTAAHRRRRHGRGRQTRQLEAAAALKLRQQVLVCRFQKLGVALVARQ